MMRTTKAAVIAWLSRLPLFIAFIGLYVALDVASFIHPLHGLNITPWNPAPALGLVLLIQIGRQAWVPLAVAIVLAEITTRATPCSTTGAASSSGCSTWPSAPC